MAKFKIATPAGASFTVEGGGYDYEMEDLADLDAEIVEGPTDEDGFIKVAQDADAIYGKGIRLSKKIIAGTKIEIVCGASRIVMEAGGKVTIEGTEFLFTASGGVKINGSTIDLN